MLVAREKPGFQALSKVLVRQGVPDHRVLHSECSVSNSG